jgi:hypothetical protein
MKLKQIFPDPLLQIQSNRSHVANQLAGRFLEREIKAAFTPAACGIDKVCGHTGLAGSRRPRH